MKAKMLPITAVVALALGSVSASAVDFHGYMRSGLNYGSQGNTYCFGNGNQGHLLGRLGDECDTYAEIALSQEVYNKANNKFTIHTLLAYGTQEDDAGKQHDHQGNSWQGVGGDGAWGGQRMSLREAYADYEMPSGITLWAGKRFYQRKDIHIMDYYYLNNSGTGFGVENIGVGNLGSLSFALIKHQIDLLDDGSDDTTYNSYKLDARWNGIPMWSDATLDIAMIYAWQKLSQHQKRQKINGDITWAHNNNGFLAFIEWTQGNFFGGFNKLSFTYGKDALDYVGALNGGNHAGDNVVPAYAKDDFGIKYVAEKGSGFRIIDWGVIEQSKWNLGYAFLFGHKHASGKNYEGANWSHPTGNDWAFVLRPSFKWSDYTSTVLEFGFFSEHNTTWTNWAVPHKDRLSATKLTLAQQWSPSTQFWARPSIRVFASWLAGDLMNPTFTNLSPNKQHEYIFGAQVEAWW